MRLIFAGFIGFVSNSLYSTDNLPRGYHELPAQIQSILADKTEIHSIQSNIEQRIHSPAGIEKRRGYYWANRDGKFRIDYFTPRESVVYDGEIIYWQIEGNPFTWKITGPRPAALPGPQQGEFSESTSIRLQKPPLLSLFPSNERTLLLTGKDGTRVEAVVDLKLKGITARRMYDTRDRLVLEELFSDPVYRKGLIFFTNVKVKAQNPATKISVTNETDYQNPVINAKISDSLFEPLPGPYRNYGQ